MRTLFYKFLFLFHKIFLLSNQNRIRVLAFHTVDDKLKFENQLKYLKHNYHLIDLIDLEDHIFCQKSLPRRSLLITFDDGDISIWERGLPVFKNLQAPAILFVITELINSYKPFWWDELKFYVGKKEGDNRVLEAKGWNNKDREEYLKNLRIKNKKGLLHKIQLTTEQLKELEVQGVSIANHSHSHPMFDKSTDVEIRNELEISSSILRSLGFSSHIFAYPNGNFDLSCEKILKEKKIKMAFLFDHKINQKKINPLRISRIRVDTQAPLFEFKVKVSGLHSWIYNIRKRKNESINHY